MKKTVYLLLFMTCFVLGFSYFEDPEPVLLILFLSATFPCYHARSRRLRMYYR